MSGAALGLALAWLVPWAGPGCAWCPAPEEVAEHLQGPGRAAAQISEQQAAFESNLSHLQIPNSFKMSVVLVSLYIIKGTWPNLAIEYL